VQLAPVEQQVLAAMQVEPHATEPPAHPQVAPSDGQENPDGQSCGCVQHAVSAMHWVPHRRVLGAHWQEPAWQVLPAPHSASRQHRLEATHAPLHARVPGAHSQAGAAAGVQEMHTRPAWQSLDVQHEPAGMQRSCAAQNTPLPGHVHTLAGPPSPGGLHTWPGAQSVLAQQPPVLEHTPLHNAWPAGHSHRRTRPAPDDTGAPHAWPPPHCESLQQLLALMQLPLHSTSPAWHWQVVGPLAVDARQ
jgi:hypothetical protein